MDFRYLIIQSIALLFWESQLANSGIDSRELVKELLKDTPDVNNIAGNEEDRENLLTLRDILARMCIDTEPYERQVLLTKIKLNIKKDPELRDDAMGVLGEELTEEQIQDRIKVLRQEIQQYFYSREFKKEIQRIASKTIFAGSGAFNVSDMARTIVASMDRFIDGLTNEDEDPMINAKGDTTNLEELAKIFMNVQDDLAPDSVIKTGWQAFNRMCGETGGLRRGNMYVVGAMPNKGKSLISSYLTLHTMLFNKPYMFDVNKKPCVVHISTENDTMLNMRIWFRYLWENHYNETCNLQDIDPAFAAKWFKEQIERNGYEFLFYHIDPTNTSYKDIIRKLMELESKGYEIHLCTIDYLAMINGDGLGDENRAFWIRQLFKVMRNYANPRKITMVIPHQVATDAAQLVRQGTDDFVKQVAGKRYWSDCRSIDMEVDMEIILNVEKSGTGANAQAYMAFGRGKDRSSLNTPENDKYFFLPFSPIGGLRPDIEGKDTSKKTIRDGSIEVDAEWAGTAPAEF